MTYKTRDIHVASFLMTLKYSLIEIDKSSFPYIFVFQGGEDIEQRVNDYFDNLAKVSPKELIESLKILRQKMTREDESY